MRLIRFLFPIFLSTAIFWAVSDFIVTQAMGTRGFSAWFRADDVAGRINTPSLSGFWGGPLDDYYVPISITAEGLRRSSPPGCSDIKGHILFLGDSTTAGYEVADENTFVSNINSSCNSHKASGVNLGIRAGDTHSAIGMYEKFSAKIAHDTVFYTITPNDFWENNDKYEYYNLTRHYGRRYDNEIISFESNWITSLYLDFRIFVSDNFYFTTKVISAFRYLRPSQKNYYNSLDEMSKKLRASMPSMKNMLMELDRAVKARKSKLVITMYPCVTPEWAHNWTANTCEEAKEIETELYGMLKTADSDIAVIEMNKLLSKYLKNECFTRASLTFPHDRHFSDFGHYVFSQIIRKYFLQDPDYDREVLCEAP